MGEVGIEQVDVNALAAVDHHRLLGVEVVLKDLPECEPILSTSQSILG